MDGAGHAKARRELTNELLVFLRVDAPKLMVHVQDVKALAHDALRPATVVDVQGARGRKHDQRRGVRAARDHEHDRGARLVAPRRRRTLEAQFRWRIPSIAAGHGTSLAAAAAPMFFLD